jgi:hypothetical protein
MELSRRALLGTGVSAALGGCLSAGRSNVEYPETRPATTPARAPGEEPLAADAEPPVTDEAEQTEPSVPNRRLAAEVARVYNEIEWFATEYDAAIDTYRRALGDAMATVQQVRDAAVFDANSLEPVRTATDRAVETTEAELGGHFGIPDQMRDRIGVHVSTIERFGRRGDLDRVDEELARLYSYLRGIRSDLFVRRVLSDRQIDSTLYRALHDDTADADGTDDANANEGEEARPGLFEIRHSTGYAGYAYAGPRYIDRDPFGAAPGSDTNSGRELLAIQRTQFEEVDEATGRTGFARVVSYAVPDAPSQPANLDPLDYNRVSVFIQRYTDASAAAVTVDTLLDTSVSREGAYSSGRDRWQRVYYAAAGDVTYAFLIQAGRFVLVAAPSEVAWEERLDWTEPLDRLWFWQP